MEKFGVEEDPEIPSKTASDGTRKCCPTCGSDLQPQELTNVLLCPKCGTKPFEAK
jgi:predicted RNA-binding Zn-ribbon protein involved in translation (DUF1610 family)